jgi:hypothetical protein
MEGSRDPAVRFAKMNWFESLKKLRLKLIRRGQGMDPCLTSKVKKQVEPQSSPEDLDQVLKELHLKIQGSVDWRRRTMRCLFIE